MLVGGSLLEAILISFTSWGALVLPGLGGLALAMLQPGVLVLGILALRPSLDIFLHTNWVIPGAATQRLNPNALLGLAIMASLIFNLFRSSVEPHRRTQADVEKDGIFQYWILFLSYVLFVSLVFSPNISASLMEFIRLISLPAVYWLAKKYMPTDPERAVLALQMILLSSLAPVGFGLYQFATGQGQAIFGVRRIYSFMGNPVVLAQYLSQIVVVGVLLLLHHRFGVKRIFTMAVLGAALLAQVLTYGKGGWVGSMVGLMMVGLMYQGKRLKIRNIVVVVLGMVALGGVVTLVLPDVADYVARIWTGTRTEDSSMVTRLVLWKMAWAAFLDNPLFGYGLGIGMLIIADSWGVPLEVHNDYIRLLVETGVVGLGLYIMIQIYVFKLILRARRLLIEIDPRFKLLVAATLALQTSYIIMISVDNLLTSMLMNYPIWILAGTVRGFYEKELVSDTAVPDSPASDPAAAAASS